MFGLTARRLVALGIMTDVRDIEFDGGNSIKLGTFKPPLTFDRFISSPRIQYKILRKSLATYHDDIIKSGLDKLLDGDIAGEPLTMSGLIGLVSQAGIKGAKSWIGNPEERARFPHTTEIFIKTNDIF